MARVGLDSHTPISHTQDKAGAKAHEVGPEQLWRMVDQDADGKLDYPEFEKLYGVMKTQGSLADEREDELVIKTRNTLELSCNILAATQCNSIMCQHR